MLEKFKTKRNQLMLKALAKKTNLELTLQDTLQEHATKRGALTMIEIIIILVIVCALAVIFKLLLSDVIDDIGAQVKTAVTNLFN